VGGGAHYRAARKNLENRTQLDEPVECASGSHPLLLYKILHLLFFPLVRILCALCLQSRKKIIKMVLMRDLWNFSFFFRLRGCLTNPFRTLSLCFGVTEKTPGLISCNNFVKRKFLSASAIAIMSWQDVTRSSLCSDVNECGTKCAHNVLFPKSSFIIRRTTVLGMFKDSAVTLDAIRRSFFDQISNSSNVYLSSRRFRTATSLFVFY